MLNPQVVALLASALGYGSPAPRSSYGYGGVEGLMASLGLGSPQPQAQPSGYGFGGVGDFRGVGGISHGGIGDAFRGVGDMLVGDNGMSPEDAVLASLVSGPVDIIGADIIGDMLVGAAKAGNPNAAKLIQAAQLAKLRQKAEQMQLAKMINPHAIDYKQESYNRSGELYLPIVPLLIPNGATGLVVLDPQVPIQVHKIFVPSSTAPFFSFTDIRVGKDSQLIAAGEMPCEGFSEVSVDSNVRLDTCQVGQKIFLSIRNKTADPHTFEGYLKGVVALR